MAPRQPSTTTQITEVKLPAWVDKASQENYERAKEIANKPYNPYTGKTVAGFAPETEQAFKYFQDNLGAGQDDLNEAGNSYRRASSTIDSSKQYFDKASGTYDKALGLIDQSRAAYDQSSPLYKQAQELFGKSSGMHDQSMDAYKKAEGIADSSQGAFDSASNWFNKGGGGILGLNRDDYMNPFIEGVENTALAALDRQRSSALRENADKAVASRAFGGSRGAIVDAVTNSEAARGAGDLSATLRKAGFDTASGLMQQDIANMFSAGQGQLGVGNGILGRANTQLGVGQGMGNAAAGVRDAAAGIGQLGGQLDQRAGGIGALAGTVGNTAAGQAALGNNLINAAAGYNTTGRNQEALGVTRQDARGKNFMGLNTIGASRQQQEQKGLDDERGKFQDAENHDLEQLNVLLSSLGMSPYGKQENTTKTTDRGSGGMDFASMGLGLLSLLPALFSDRDAKTDITKLGKDPESGIDLYAYRYKGDPKSYPKVVGPMAQDIEKAVPGSTRRVGGKLMISGALAR